jgi:hypothetical protein
LLYVHVVAGWVGDEEQGSNVEVPRPYRLLAIGVLGLAAGLMALPPAVAVLAVLGLIG